MLCTSVHCCLDMMRHCVLRLVTLSPDFNDDISHAQENVGESGRKWGLHETAEIEKVVDELEELANVVRDGG